MNHFSVLGNVLGIKSALFARKVLSVFYIFNKTGQLPYQQNMSFYIMWFIFSEPAVTAFGSLKPSDPSFVRELDNITLKWNYTIDGSIGQAQFANATDDETIAGKFGDGDVNVVSDYQERFRADISNTLAQLTILTVQRSDSGRYKFLLTSSKFGTISDTVELKVQCK